MIILPQDTVGIEVAGQDLTVAVVHRGWKKLRLLALHRIAGFVGLNESERKIAVQTLFKNARISTSRAYLAISRDQGLVRQMDLPPDVGQKLRDVVRLQVETLSPWPLSDIYWDFAVEPEKKNRKLVMVTIGIIPRNLLDPWMAFFKSAGVPLSGASLSSLAYGHAATVLWAEPTPIVILHREGSSTEGIVVNENRIAAMSGSSDENSASGFMDRLFSVAKLPSPETSRLIVCGGDLDASLLQDNPRLPLENAKADSTSDFGAIAAALLSFKESAFKSNLVPAELRYRESQLKLIPTYVLGCLAICMGLLLLVRGPYQNTAYAGRLDSEIQKIAPQVREVTEQEAELNKLSDQYRALAEQLRSHDYNLEALRELARVLPDSAFLSSYGYQDGTITVSGYAESASEIQSLLEGSSLFKGVEFTNSVTRDAAGKDRFTLKMLIEAGK